MRRACPLLNLKLDCVCNDAKPARKACNIDKQPPGSAVLPCSIVMSRPRATGLLFLPRRIDCDCAIGCVKSPHCHGRRVHRPPMYAAPGAHLSNAPRSVTSACTNEGQHKRPARAWQNVRRRPLNLWAGVLRRLCFGHCFFATSASLSKTVVYTAAASQTTSVCQEGGELVASKMRVLPQRGVHTMTMFGILAGYLHSHPLSPHAREVVWLSGARADMCMLPAKPDRRKHCGEGRRGVQRAAREDARVVDQHPRLLAGDMFSLCEIATHKTD